MTSAEKMAARKRARAAAADAAPNVPKKARRSRKSKASSGTARKSKPDASPDSEPKATTAVLDELPLTERTDDDGTQQRRG